MDSLTLLTFIIFLSLLNYKVKTFHFLEQNYEPTTSPSSCDQQPSSRSHKPVYLFFKVLRGPIPSVELVFIHSLSPYRPGSGSGSGVLAGFRLPGLRGTPGPSQDPVMGGAAGPGWARSWARLKMERRGVTTVRKISLVATQQPLEHQGRECSSASERNNQIIAPQT